MLYFVKIGLGFVIIWLVIVVWWSISRHKIVLKVSNLTVLELANYSLFYRRRNCYLYDNILEKRYKTLYFTHFTNFNSRLLFIVNMLRLALTPSVYKVYFLHSTWYLFPLLYHTAIFIFESILPVLGLRL